MDTTLNMVLIKKTTKISGVSSICKVCGLNAMQYGLLSYICFDWDRNIVFVFYLAT